MGTDARQRVGGLLRGHGHGRATAVTAAFHCSTDEWCYVRRCDDLQQCGGARAYPARALSDQVEAAGTDRDRAEQQCHHRGPVPAALRPYMMNGQRSGWARRRQHRPPWLYLRLYLRVRERRVRPPPPRHTRPIRRIRRRKRAGNSRRAPERARAARDRALVFAAMLTVCHGLDPPTGPRHRGAVVPVVVTGGGTGDETSVSVSDASTD